MEENNKQSEEFLSQLANIAESFNFLSPTVTNIGVELELEEDKYYNSTKEVTTLTKIISSDIDSRYILYIDNIRFTIIKINK